MEGDPVSAWGWVSAIELELFSEKKIGSEQLLEHVLDLSPGGQQNKTW